MWLLRTDRAELHFFVSPESVPVPGYAIVSHVWDSKEQSFQQLQTLAAECALSGQNPRDHVSEKIRRCCELAQSQGYAWLWADMCCIDKSSSAELSEAINSMFRYYSLSDVCYVYLRDVPSKAEGAFACNLTGSSLFRSSRWHRRGWTLQELLAPSVVFFLSSSWESLGSKADLAEQLEEATGIPQSVLRLKTKLSDISIAQRMSWAAFRQTARAEDEAYCLMGIFDVTMPTLYGEGRRAFQRLQEEIMKQSTDTTLFAWGRLLDFAQLESSDSIAPCGLFATSPLPFRGCAGLVYRGSNSSQKRHTSRSTKNRGGPPTFTITPHGVLAHVPMVDYQGCVFADLGWSESEQRVMLALAPRPRGTSSLSYPVYDIHGDRRLVRVPITDVKHNRHFLRLCPASPMRVTWEDIYIAHRRASSGPSPQARVHPSLPPIPINNCVSAPFRFPERRIKDLEGLINGTLEDVQNVHLPWTGDPPTTFTFRVSNMNFMVIAVGRCSFHLETPPPPYLDGSDMKSVSDAPSLSPLWANVQWNPRAASDVTSSDPPGDHDCTTDHIAVWPDLEKTFVLLPDGSHRDGCKFFRLSFTRCPISTSGTLILDVTVQEQRFMPHTLGDNTRIISVDEPVVYAI